MNINNKLDKLWADKVKEVGKCEVCGKKTHLNAHHLFSRTNYSLRWDLDNGICLCSGCHTLNSSFSAHKTGIEFTFWIIDKKGIKFINMLRDKAKNSKKPSLKQKKELLDKWTTIK